MTEHQGNTAVALYARVSSERQDVDLSVAAQLRALREYAEKNGYLVAREYIDEAESGRIAERPQFRRMIDDATEADAPFKEILVWKFSRFTRKREHAVAFKSMLRRRGVRVVSITEHADDSPMGKLMEAIIESVDEFYSENLAQEVSRGMQEAATRGFWMTGMAPYGYQKVYVQDGSKKRPKLEPNPPEDAVVRRMFEMALERKSTLEIAKALNADGIGTAKGKRWGKTRIHEILTNEVYVGTIVWGMTGKPTTQPVRVENAFPAIVTHEEFSRVGKTLESRSPRMTHPRRAASPYLLSGIIMCESCGKSMIASEAKSGRYTYYVCQSILKRGKGTCDTPRLSAAILEQQIVDTLREHVLSENNIRRLVVQVDEEMDGEAHDLRRKLESTDSELGSVRRRLDNLYDVVESGDFDTEDLKPRIQQLKERQAELEGANDEARIKLAGRRRILDRIDTITAYAKEMSDFLKTSELTATKAFVHSFVKNISVKGHRALIRYAVPMPEDNPIGQTNAAEIDLGTAFRNTVWSGTPGRTRTADTRFRKPMLYPLSYRGTLGRRLLPSIPTTASCR